MSSNPQVTIGVSAVDTARQTLQQVDSKIRETTSIVEDSGAKITTIGQRIKDNWQNLAATATGLVSGVTGFATSFDVLQKAQTNADRANLTYQKSLAKLEEMQKSGKYSAEELARQQEAVRINSEKLAQAQDNLGDTYTNFLANIPAQMLGFGTAAIGIFNTLRTTQIANAATSVASSATYSGALASMNAATITTTGALNGFRIASIMAFLTNPATAAILGISTLIVLLTTNAFGLRDAFVWLGETIYNTIVSAFQPLIDILGTLFGKTNDVNAAIGRDMQKAASAGGQALDNMKTSISETATITDSLQVSVKRAAEETDTSTKSMATSWQKLTSDIQIEVAKIQQIYRTVPNPLGGYLQVAVDNSMFGSMPVSSIGGIGAIDYDNVGTPGGNFGGASLGTLAGNTSYLNAITAGATVKKNALGGEGMVYQPTLFLAGDNGPEGFKFTPGKPASNGDIGDIYVTINQKGFDIESIEVALANNRRKKWSLRKQGVYGGH